MKIGIDTTFLVQVTVREHPLHESARTQLDQHLVAGDTFALAPQVMAEFVHVVTDPRRFEHQLNMTEAREKAQAWWTARETERVAPTLACMDLFWHWMEEHNLGRKRLLDTMLAATYFGHQIDTILTSNARDFSVFGCFRVIVPS